MQQPQRGWRIEQRRLLFALAVALLGIINGLTDLLPTRPGRLALLIDLLNQLAPFSPSVWPILETGRTLALVLGFFLLVIAFGLARGKRRAWQFALLLLPLSVLAHLARGLSLEEAVVSFLLWLGLLSYASSFRVASDPGRLRQGILLLLCGALLLVIYTVSGLSLLQTQLLLPGTPGGLIRSLLFRLVKIPAAEIVPLSRHASWFLDSLPWLGAVVLLTGALLLLRPVSARWWAAYQKERLVQARQRARQLVRRYGSETLSFFALAPENLLYLSPGGEGVVSYRLSGTVAVVLGDPIAPPEAWERVTRSFLEMCAANDWQVALYQAHPEYLPMYRALGLHAFKIGEEALLSPQTFTLSGSAMANVRTSCRRAERAGVTVQWYEGVPPASVLEHLEPLSQEWLEHKAGQHAVEMGFSMGRLDELVEAAQRADAIASLPMGEDELSLAVAPRLVAGVATDSTGHPCAFVTFTPIYGSKQEWGWALDLMRRSADAPPGVMDLLLARAVEHLRAAGANVVSLSMVGLSDTRQEMKARQRQFAQLLSEQLYFLKTHRTLFHFKQKFHPCWQSRYVVVSSALALPRLALALLRVHHA